jgi:hypothetical protein
MSGENKTKLAGQRSVSFYLLFLILLLHIAGLWDLLWNNNKELNLEGVFLL